MEEKTFLAVLNKLFETLEQFIDYENNNMWS